MLPNGVLKINPDDTLHKQWNSIIDELIKNAKKGYPFVVVDTITDELREKLESEFFILEQLNDWCIVNLDQYKHPRYYGYVDKHTLQRIQEKQNDGGIDYVTLRDTCSDSLQLLLHNNGYTITNVNSEVIKISW